MFFYSFNLIGVFVYTAHGATFKFLAVGDWGAALKSPDLDDSSQLAQNELEDRRTMRSVASSLADHVLDCKFVLALGDNFYEYGVDSVEDPQWEGTWRTNWIEAHPKVAGIPWYPVLGNHDYRQGFEAAQSQVLRTGAADDDEWQFPSRSWSRTIVISPSSNLVVVGLDTEQLAPDLFNLTALFDRTAVQAAAEEAEQYLKAAAANPSTTWLVVAGHYPVLSQGEHGDTADLCALFLPLFETYGVDLYLSGHDHTLQHAEFQETHYVVSGAGARSDGFIRDSSPYTGADSMMDPAPGRNTLFAVKEHGFSRHDLAFTSEGSLMTTSFISSDGSVLYSYEQTPRCKRKCNSYSSPSEPGWERNVRIILGWALAILCIALVGCVFHRARKRSNFRYTSIRDLDDEEVKSLVVGFRGIEELDEISVSE